MIFDVDIMSMSTSTCRVNLAPTERKDSDGKITKQTTLRPKCTLDEHLLPTKLRFKGHNASNIAAKQVLSLHVMTGNQFEPVTPQPHPTEPIASARTWQQPKIRLHNRAHSTPRSTALSLNSKNFRSTRIRVTDPSLLETTPVTNSTTPKPLRFRIAGTEPQPDVVCRQLFPTPRPSKRPRNAAPSFRFSCGRERTQPATDSNGRGQYSDALLASVTQAHRNSRIFRNAVTTATGDTDVETAMGDGLLLEIFDRQNEFLLLRSSNHPHGDFTVHVALVMTDELVPKLTSHGLLRDRDFSEFLIYIPYPWHAHVLDGFAVCRSRILIASHTADIFRKEHILLREGLNKLTLLALQPFIEDINHVLPCESDPHHQPDYRFATISPHSAVTNLSVYVDFYDSEHHVAIIRDDAGEFAVLLINNDNIRARSDKYDFYNVSILPYQIPLQVMFEIAGTGSNDEFRSRLKQSRETFSSCVFKHEQNPL